MTDSLDTRELLQMVERVFRPAAEDRSIAVMIDLPDARRPDNDDWADRRRLAADWYRRLVDGGRRLGLERVSLVCYPNVGSNNADLPQVARLWEGDSTPDDAAVVAENPVPMEQVLHDHRLMLVLSELSATAPMKLNAPRIGFRAATMPGFSRAMIPALRLDYGAIHERCVELKQLLDRSSGARIVFRAKDVEQTLHLDLRHRSATASGGLVTQPGTAGNVPSGETYIVPYEGEVAGDPSRTAGTLPLELEGELLAYRISENRVSEVLGEGPVAARERQAMAEEPAYRNVAELGLGLLADYGIRPIGELLLDEKLGLHIAFGRSDHFGGQVGAADFRSPDRVVHIDRVYLPEVQPGVAVLSVDLELDDGPEQPLMREGRYV